MVIVGTIKNEIALLTSGGGGQYRRTQNCRYPQSRQLELLLLQLYLIGNRFWGGMSTCPLKPAESVLLTTQTVA